MLSHLSRGAMVTVFAGTCCLGFAAVVGVPTRCRARAHRSSKRRRGVERRGAARDLASQVHITPASGTANLSPDVPVVVDTKSGNLVSVRVSATGSAPVAGRYTNARTTWQSGGSLAYNTAYVVTATVEGSHQSRVKLTSTFRTFAPVTTVTASVFPTDGLSVGVGQPIVFRFDHDITSPAAQSALLSHLDVSESQPVAGGWHWFSPTELHFRPQDYWPANEKVAVAWDLRGWNAGDPVWGDGVGVVHFSVGDARDLVREPGDASDDRHRQRPCHRDLSDQRR